MEAAGPAEHSVILHRQDEPLRSRITLTLHTDGHLVLDSLDTASAFWGGGDYAFTIDLAPESFPRLKALLLEALTAEERSELAALKLDGLPREVFTLLETKYAGDAQAVADLTDLCKKEGIPHRLDTAVSYRPPE